MFTFDSPKNLAENICPDFPAQKEIFEFAPSSSFLYATNPQMFWVKIGSWLQLKTWGIGAVIVVRLYNTVVYLQYLCMLALLTLLPYLITLNECSFSDPAQNL